MGPGITKLFKSNDFDVSPIVYPKPVDVTKLKEKSKAVDQKRRSIHSISENIPHELVVRTERHHKRQELPPLKKAPKHLRKLGRTPKHVVEPKPLPGVIASSTDASDSEHSSQQVSDCQLSPTEKQRLTKQNIQFEFKSRQISDGELSPSQKEMQIIGISDTNSRTVYQNSDDKTTNIEDQQSGKTRSQQSLISTHVQTTSLTDSDKGHVFLILFICKIGFLGKISK